MIPLLWLVFGAILPTIPCMATALVCCFALTGMLPLAALMTLFAAPRIGRGISIASLSWGGVLAALLILEELYRAAVTDYPDPPAFTAAVVGSATIVLATCMLEIAWLLRASRGDVGLE